MTNLSDCLSKEYANFYFSIAAIIKALPLGSTAKYCPGTILLHPLLPNVSSCVLTKQALD